MTFDDGILKIYQIKNCAEPGHKPEKKAEWKADYYFNQGELGFTRVYKAMQARQQVDMVANVPDWEDIKALDVCVMEDGQQYRIGLVQPTHDENGLRITRLSLERISEGYEL